MFECEKCGKPSGQRMFKCRYRRSEECPYVYMERPLSIPISQGYTLFILGLALIWVILYFPFFPFEPTSSVTFFVAALKITLLGLILLIGVVTAFLGFAILFTRRNSLYSISEQNSWQSYSLRGYEYRVRSMTDLQSVPIASERLLSSELPGSLVTCSAFAGKVSDDKLLSRICEAALLGLAARGQIVLHSGRVYESSGKSIDGVSRNQACFVLPGPQVDILVRGKLEKRIMEVVRNWNENPAYPESPLGPSISMLFESCVGYVGVGEYKLNRALDEFKMEVASELDSENQGLINSCTQDLEALTAEVHSSYPKLVEVFGNDLRKVLFDSELRKTGLGIFRILDQISFKTMRTGMATAIIILFFVGLYSLRVEKFRRVKDFVEDSLIGETDADGGARQAKIQSIIRSTEDALSGFKSKFSNVKKELFFTNLRSLIDLDPSRITRAYERYKRYLKKALVDQDARIRRAAAETLGYFGRAAESSIDNLIGAMLGDADAYVRRAAADALGKIGVNPKRVVPALIKAIKDPDQLTRSISIRSIGEFGAAATSAIPALTDALPGSNGPMRRQIEDTLRKIGTPGALQALKPGF